MIGHLDAELRAAWSRRGDTAPERLHWLKFATADYPGAGTPFVFFAFRDQAAHPAAVAKVARDAAGDATVEHECVMLQSVRDRITPALARLVPEPLAGGVLNGRRFGLWTALGGTIDLHNLAGPRGARRATKRITAALDFLRELQGVTSAAPVRAAEWMGTWDTVRAELAAAGSPPDVLATLSRVAATAWETQWPAAFAHGDFFPGNVLFTGDAVSGVIDWATAAPHAPLFLDSLGYELSFALYALSQGRDAATAERRATAALAPFAARSAQLAAAGIEAGWGSVARLLAVTAGALSETRSGAPRAGVASLWLRLLELEARDFGAHGPQ